MKKLYLLLLVFLLLFIPATNAVTPYQLDHPIRELNNHTLREIFENRNMAIPDLTGKTEISAGVYRLSDTYFDIILDYNIDNGQFIMNGTSGNANPWGINYIIINIPINDTYTVKYNIINNGINSVDAFLLRQDLSGVGNEILDMKNNSQNTLIITQSHISIRINAGDFTNHIFTLQLEKGSTPTPYQVSTDGPYSDIDVGDFNLTSEQIDMYYDYYLKAVQFEIDYYEAGQDPGEYQLIFKSIINGVKNLISEMAGVWEFLNAPIVSTNPDDFGFNIDWSWDLIGVIKQIFNNLAIIILQVSFLIPTAIFNIFNIPVRISLLSLLFTNFVFVLLGWIVVKSFII